MEKLALADFQNSNVASGVAGTLGVGAAGGLTAMLPSKLETLRKKSLTPMWDAWSGFTHTRGSDARRFVAQDKAMLRNIAKYQRAGDNAKALKLAKQLVSPTHRAWRGFKAHSLPGKFKLLAPVLGTAAGAVGLGTAGVYGAHKAVIS